ncbi:thioredoxin family protein [bacterium]|jgi:peroxiredoxin|nr:thioredoxin family protein [bacterium]MDG1393309.1 thioredoxin family protein [Flavobacteriaceae bacterium]
MRRSTSKFYHLKEIILLLFVLFSTLAFTPIPTENGYDIGDVVTDFKLENIDGKFVSLSDFETAKGFIVVFTCNTCPYAVLYEDRIEALNKKYAKLGYPVIAIMPNNVTTKPGDSMEAMQQRAKEKGFTFPYLMDVDQLVYPQFGATKTPHTYILKSTKSGPVVQYIGAIDDNYSDPSLVKTYYVENAVDTLLNGGLIEVSKTKAIGCSIKI